MGSTPFNDEVDLSSSNIGVNPVTAYNKKVEAFNKDRVNHETMNGLISILGLVGSLCINIFVHPKLRIMLRLKEDPKENEKLVFSNMIVELILGILFLLLGYYLLFYAIAPLFPFGKVLMIIILIFGAIKLYRDTDRYIEKKANRVDRFEKRYQALVEEGAVVAQKEQEWKNAIQAQRQRQAEQEQQAQRDQFNAGTSTSEKDPFNTFYDGSDT